MANVLFLFPHPDDETLFAGGSMLRHTQNGDRVICILASNGEKSGHSKHRSSVAFFIAYYLLGYLRFFIFIQKIIIKALSIFRKPNKELSIIRKGEAKKALGLLGIEKIIFWGIEDMNFSQRKEKLIELIKRHIELHEPEIIYTFHSSGITGHLDHIILTECLMRALQYINSEKLKVFGATIPKSIVKKYKLPFFGIDDFKIEKEILLDENETEKKREALSAYASQRYLWSIFLQKHPLLIKREYFSRLR